MSDKRYVFKKQCGTCSHLIFKDYKHHEGRCSISGCDKHFEDLCEFSHNIDRGCTSCVYGELYTTFRANGIYCNRLKMPSDNEFICDFYKIRRDLIHGTTTEC